MSPIESLHPEAYNLPLELRSNELGLIFLYRLRNNATYTESLNTLDDRKNQNYKKNEGATKPKGIHLRKLEQEYMKEQRGGKTPPGTTTPMVNKQCTLLI